MIKCVGLAGSKQLLLLGLSRANTTRLHQGQPIRFNLRDIATGGLELPDLVVVICAGETEREIHQELKREGFFDEATKFRIGPGRHGKDGG